MISPEREVCQAGVDFALFLNLSFRSVFFCPIDRVLGEAVGLLEAFGWSVIDLGGIEGSRSLEPLAILWITYGFRTNTWNHAFKLLRK